MLRNEHHTVPVGYEHCLLNEVLSLNAQESMTRKSISVLRALLNEVLSLNAQECRASIIGDGTNVFLNEVLSLNAQESVHFQQIFRVILSSMKS